MNKILSFIVNEKEELLLLLGSKNDPQFKKSFWYVVTGGCEEFDNTLIETVKREIKEETNLEIKDSIYLNWIFNYNSLGKNCTEYAFISHVKDAEIVLNEESIDYKWCKLDEFIKLIKWYGSKEELKKVIEEALKNKVFFKEEKVENF